MLYFSVSQSLIYKAGGVGGATFNVHYLKVHVTTAI